MRFNTTSTALLIALSIAGTQVNATVFSKPSQPIVLQTDDEIQEMGVLRSIEDSGYPFVNVTIEFVERKFSESFTINLEEVKNINMAILNKWKGKYVSFGYVSESSNALLDIKFRGKSLLGDEAVEVGPESKTITGILKGAKQATGGDVPDVISINGTTFEFFITPEMVNANGKTVTAIYEERTENTIKRIKVLK